MDEAEYKITYKQVNQYCCVYEKAISSRRCNCSQSSRFHLADREGVACQSREGLEWCKEFLTICRKKSRFSLHLMTADKPLPHANEIRVQVGSLLGLQISTGCVSSDNTTVTDIYGHLKQAISRFKQINDFPYEEIIRSVAKFEGRKKRSRSKK